MSAAKRALSQRASSQLVDVRKGNCVRRPKGCATVRVDVVPQRIRSRDRCALRGASGEAGSADALEANISIWSAIVIGAATG